MKPYGRVHQNPAIDDAQQADMVIDHKVDYLHIEGGQVNQYVGPSTLEDLYMICDYIQEELSRQGINYTDYLRGVAVFGW